MTYSLLWLPQVLRAAGLKVVELPGWQDRGHGDMGEVKGVLCHHTAGPLTGEFSDLDVLVKGRPDLAGPLSQLGLGRSGTFYIACAGKGWHAGAGNWQGITAGNSHFIGIEAENAGTSADPWPEVQLDAYARGAAAILKHIGATSIMAAGHKEYALPKGRKDDPSFDMAAFRNRVATLMGAEHKEPDVTPTPTTTEVVMDPTDTRIHASIRTKNPGAMWGHTGPRSTSGKIDVTNAPIPKKWGSTRTVFLSDGLNQGNNIAVFDKWVDGICAQLDLWRSSEHYKNKRFVDAIGTWSGGNNVPSYIAYCKARVPGLTEDTIMNDAFWQSPSGILFLKAQAGHEAGQTYPAPDADWIEAQRRVFSGAPPTPAPAPATPLPKSVPPIVGGVAGGATTVVVASHAGWSALEIGLTAFIVAGLVATVVLMIRKLRS